MFISSLFSDFRFFIWWIVIIIVSVCIHEIFHALAASFEGDSTAKERGYITVDPIKHLGITSLITLFLFGLCWGKCPVDQKKFRHSYSKAFVAFAGPFSNILLLLLFIFLYFIFLKVDFAISANIRSNLLDLFELAGKANAALFLLNMIPIPPLDGSRIAEHFIPSAKSFYSQIGMTGLAILFVLFWFPVFSQVFWNLSDSMIKGVFTCYSVLLI